MCKFIIPILFFVVSSFVLANSRAPMNIDAAKTGNLKKPISGVEVQKEVLNINCEKNLCTISANYKFFSKKSHNAELQFIAPQNDSIKVKTNGSFVPVKIEPFMFDRRNTYYPIKGDKLIQGVFEMHIKKGENSLNVHYQQYMGAMEEGRSGDFYFYITYELWPLKQWKLSPNFKMYIKVSWLRIENLFESIFKTQLAKCKNKYGPIRSIENGKEILEYNFTLKFPNPTCLFL